MSRTLHTEQNGRASLLPNICPYVRDKRNRIPVDNQQNRNTQLCVAVLVGPELVRSKRFTAVVPLIARASNLGDSGLRAKAGTVGHIAGGGSSTSGSSRAKRVQRRNAGIAQSGIPGLNLNRAKIEVALFGGTIFTR